MAANGLVDSAGVLFQIAVYHGMIEPVKAVFLDLGSQGTVGLVILGHYQ